MDLNSGVNSIVTIVATLSGAYLLNYQKEKSEKRKLRLEHLQEKYNRIQLVLYKLEPDVVAEHMDTQ